MNMKKSMRRNGFTLVELMAVMAVIAVLAAMVLGISGYASRKSDESKALADIETIKNLLEEYRVEKGVYPEEGNFKSVMKAADETFFYETDELKDPWGRDYVYDKHSKFLISVYSRGPDGADGSADDVGQRNYD
jgi:general secretion pathway protein G